MAVVSVCTVSDDLSHSVQRYIQPIADRVAQNLEIIPKKIQRTRILPMGCTISTKFYMMNPMRILVLLVLN